MSTDRNVTDQLVTTLEDGRKGFAAGADRLRENGAERLAAVFDTCAAERARFADELTSLASSYGDDIEESGSTLGTLHRGWMTVLDTISGSSIDGVLNAALEGERHTAKHFDEALQADISDDLRSVVVHQATDIGQVRARLEALEAQT